MATSPESTERDPRAPLKRAFRRFHGWMILPAARRYGPLIPAALTVVIFQKVGGRFGEGRGSWTLAILFLAAYAASKMLWDNFLSFRLLSTTLRYDAVLDVLNTWDPFFPSHPNLVEVGSGAEGIANRLSYPIHGCDTFFDGAVAPTLTPTVCSATRLPFPDNAFDVVLSLDMMEHIPTDALRREALEEMWRVAKDGLIIGYPAGPAAYRAEQELLSCYRQKGLPVPVWLKEHLENGLPAVDLMEIWLDRRAPIALISNESVPFHLWLTKKETSLVWNLLFLLGLIFLKPVIRVVLRSFGGTDNPYRRLYVIAKNPALVARLEKSGLAGRPVP